MEGEVFLKGVGWETLTPTRKPLILPLCVA